MTSRKKYDPETHSVTDEPVPTDDTNLRLAILELAVENGTGRGGYDTLDEAEKMYAWVTRAPELVPEG